jgi:Family of unknown function (DUF6350)
MDEGPGSTQPIPPVPPPHWGPPAESPRRGRTAARLFAGWTKAVIGAVATIVVAGVASLIISLLAYISSDDPKPSFVQLARLGGFVFYAFNRVGLVFSGTSADFADVRDVRITTSLLMGTVLLLWLLARAGRDIADETGGSALARGLHGAKVGLPYALICFGLAFLVAIPEGAITDFPKVHPHYLAAFLWPLAWGCLGGFVGGARSAPDPATEASWSRWSRVALSGGLRMVGLGLLLGFISLVAMAPFAPDVTKAYFHPFTVDTTAGLATLYATLLGLPNVVAQLVLFPAMNVCTTAAASASGSGVSFNASACALSWFHFPPSASSFGQQVPSVLGGGSIVFPKPSPVYYLFILVPVVTVLLGGAIAARRARAVDRREALVAGAVAGVVFGLLSLLLAFVATPSIRLGVSFEEIPIRVRASLGPNLLTALLFGLAWGVIGGALGGLIHGRRLPAGQWRRQPAPADDTSGFTV